MNLANTVVEECDSTNDLARQLAEAGAPHGTWISARRQGAGRGRLGRKWESIEGNLFLSIVARIAPSVSWSWIPMATAVAVAECLRELNPGWAIEIKWPNDLWLDRKKLGGILCEAVGNRQDSFVIIGLGLNCVKAPQGLDQEAISLDVSADEVRLPIISAILSVLSDLQTAGSSVILRRYESLAVLRAGTGIEWKSGEQTFYGTVEATGSSGELIVRNAAGQSVRLYAEDVKVRLSASS